MQAIKKVLVLKGVIGIKDKKRSGGGCEVGYPDMTNWW